MLTKLLVTTMMCILGMAMSSNSPVFLWGVDSPKKPSLQSVKQEEFGEIVAPLLKDTMVVAFLEENLSAKDFLCTNTQSAASCYAHLQGVSPKTFYANVENPVEALRAVATEREFNSVDKSGKLATPLPCDSGKVVFVNFESTKSDRGATLEAHDAAISAISKDIKCPAVYMYLSAPSAVSTAPQSHRVRREVVDTRYSCFRKDSQFLLCYTKLLIDTPIDGRVHHDELVVNSMSVISGKDSQSRFTVILGTTTKAVTFNISLVDGYFSMGNVVVGDVTFRARNIEAPTDFSFSCGNLTLSAIWKSPTEPIHQVLRWNNLQFQAPFNSKYSAKFAFGDAWSCTGFFSPAILSGLFVVVIMLMIVFTGICWMMDINTMDRFDDPKGKTITINATD